MRVQVGVEYLGVVHGPDGPAHGDPLRCVQGCFCQTLHQVARIGNHGHDDVGGIALTRQLLASGHRRRNRQAACDHPSQQAEFAHGAAVARRAAWVAVGIEARDQTAAPVVAQHHVQTI